MFRLNESQLRGRSIIYIISWCKVRNVSKSKISHTRLLLKPIQVLIRSAQPNKLSTSKIDIPTNYSFCSIPLSSNEGAMPGSDRNRVNGSKI
uniref:Uncharacterized protein n=1 Tax=Arundo donax TaxID=35708 RepID=A0A0A9EAK0_ARUDO